MLSVITRNVGIGEDLGDGSRRFEVSVPRDWGLYSFDLCIDGYFVTFEGEPDSSEPEQIWCFMIMTVAVDTKSGGSAVVVPDGGYAYYKTIVGDSGIFACHVFQG